MDDWLTILHAVGGVLSAAAATATLINTFVRVRRGGRRKTKSSDSHQPRVSIRGRFVRVARGRKKRAKEVDDAQARTAVKHR